MRKTKNGETWHFLVNMVRACLVFPTDECVEWIYGTSDKGYGYIRYPRDIPYAPMVVVTNVVLALSGQPWHPPLGAFALHSCDNPPCINPRHLRWGWFNSNKADSMARGRQKTNPYRDPVDGRFTTAPRFA